ncbi:MAG TPA: pitrilysin family protein [Gemmatimonadales bacterium]|nr:pitrilysin family protein [Gemmatimonadales bacterium]
MIHRFSGRLAALAAATLVAAAAVPAAAQRPAPRPVAAPVPDIPFQRFVLGNGLTLIVHEDHKAPIAAVNVWYHVGSKNEKRGRTGFAHLFEHLMFNGSENHKGEFFTPFEQAGATDMNGTTNEDRTNYFENVPVNALDMALWMESDRMGHLLGAIDQAKLDEQRGVVQNEKREGENQPYGRVFDFLLPRIYPPNHPYSWSTIGSMEDLNAAKLDDVKEWFQTYYGAANAVLVIAGDVNTAEVREKVERYFGNIPSGPPIEKQSAWIAKRSGHQRGIMQDRVPQARLYRVWNTPGWGTADGDYLNLVSDVLASGKTSRLYKRLVYDDQIATDVTASISPSEIAGSFYIWATARPGDDLAKVEKAIDEELARFLRAGPTPAELERVKTRHRADFIRGIERIGGFGGKSDVLAQGQVFSGRPDAYKQHLGRLAAASPADLLGAAKRWLSDGDYTLEVVPFPEYQTAATGADRTRLPATGTPPDTRFPALQRATLSNGLKVVLAERPSIPQVRFDLVLDAGYAADQFAAPGTANMTLAMLDEGTKTRSSLRISEELARLGASYGTFQRLDYSSVSLEALTENLEPSLALFTDIVLNPSFPQSDFDRLKRQALAGIAQEKADPVSTALRVLPGLVYGKGHAYAQPWTGTGTEASVSGLERKDVVAFHHTWFRPNHATLIVVGATTMAEIRPKLERALAGWQPGEIPSKNVSRVEPPAASTVYLVDRPGSQQTVVVASNVAPPKNNPAEPAIETMNAVLGANFGSRINLNLREDKHWSYGAFTIFRDARGQRPFVAYAPVQTDKTKESIVELARELRGILGPRPIEPNELETAKSTLTLTLPGSWETMAAVAASIRSITVFGLDDRYFDTYGDRVRRVTAAEAVAAAGQTVLPERLVWVVVGDRGRIEAGIRELGLGEIKLIDADGNPLGASASAR